MTERDNSEQQKIKEINGNLGRAFYINSYARLEKRAK